MPNVSATDRTVTDVTHDSRQAREGTLFVAIKGETVGRTSLCRRRNAARGGRDNLGIRSAGEF